MNWNSCAIRLNKLKKLKKWLHFAILNQEQLKTEYVFIEFPDWNTGYLEALKDMKKLLNG